MNKTELIDKIAAEAYDVLHDSQKRQNYDRFGFDAPQMGGGAGFGGAGFSVDDIFSMYEFGIMAYDVALSYCPHCKVRFFLSVPIQHRYPCICFETR